MEASNTNTSWKDKPPYAFTGESKSFKAKYSAQCYCGSVQYEINDDPVDSTYCHCKGCQRLQGAPLQWASIFHKSSIRFTKGVDQLIFYNNSTNKQTHELPCKVYCRDCRTPLADEGRNMWLAFPMLFKQFDEMKEKLRPSCHLFYGQRCVDIKDGLPKFEGHKNKSQQIQE
ncbi:unnamed protein product [Didymodactylos carnosus]|uniref:CENP-V/GFA domain-containing protein n=1 Tax=Didymodactylos carnosus TaxID=1234261 RepID=A0A814B6D2_9BILA|nr:unnamed protein product [Didymodactylos carnosus]CAF0921665.1 unnamed protein product [Didymodactylos carnosus]CAF3583014.1 unnamed protein product [Didymodactylos carnosus]CAF3700881.1 unnamed protein product [Didymodactylos carnosus]